MKCNYAIQLSVYQQHFAIVHNHCSLQSSTHKNSIGENYIKSCDYVEFSLQSRINHFIFQIPNVENL